MLCSPGNKINNSQIIGELVDQKYRTRTGGFIKHRTEIDEKEKIQNLLWISEETHEIKKDISLLMVENDTYIEAGTEIIKDIKTHNSGYLEIIEENGIVEKLIIKIGKIVRVSELESHNLDLPKIFENGEEIYNGIIAESTVFVEKIKNGILIRPVDEYQVNQEEFKIEAKHSLDYGQSININLVQHLLIKDEEKIEKSRNVKE